MIKDEGDHHHYYCLSYDAKGNSYFLFAQPNEVFITTLYASSHEEAMRKAQERYGGERVDPSIYDSASGDTKIWTCTSPAENPKTSAGRAKPDLSLIPPVALLHIARAMETGAEKYGAYNWRTTRVPARTYIAAAMRHLGEYLDCADHSSDTTPPVHSLAHAAACCAILLDAIESDCLDDDRASGPAQTVCERMLKEKTK